VIAMQTVDLIDDVVAMQDVHWSELIASKDKDGESFHISESERKRRESVWELFTSECVFLVDHIMVLKHVSLL